MEVIKVKRTLILATLVVVLVSFAAAKDFELSLNGGLAVNPRWDMGPVFGIAGSMPLKANIKVEAEFFYYMKTVEDPGIQGLEVSGSGWDLNLYAHYLFNTSKGKLKPYASLGFGVFNISQEWNWAGFGGWDDNVTKLNVGIGGGARLPLNEKSGLRVDIRYIVIFGVIGDVIRITAGYCLKL